MAFGNGGCEFKPQLKQIRHCSVDFLVSIFCPLLLKIAYIFPKLAKFVQKYGPDTAA